MNGSYFDYTGIRVTDLGGGTILHPGPRAP